MWSTLQSVELNFEAKLGPFPQILDYSEETFRKNTLAYFAHSSVTKTKSFNSFPLALNYEAKLLKFSERLLCVEKQNKTVGEML